MPSVNAIGPYQFVTLSGVPRGIARQLEVIERAGVDGSGIQRTGRRGRPFRLRSLVDCNSFAEADVMVEAYRLLIGEAPVELVWNGRQSSLKGYLVVVLDVEPVDVAALVTAVGGLTGLGVAHIVAEWTLLPVYI